MHIQDEHLYHGAALNQIAEHERFTAINSLKMGGKTSHNAFRINDEVSLYPKYCKNPTGRYKEYKFTFTEGQLDEIARIHDNGDALYIALVCVKDREICCISYATLNDLIAKRHAAAGNNENQYQLLVTLNPRQAFRLYVNSPGQQGITLGRVIIPRKRFPDMLFD